MNRSILLGLLTITCVLLRSQQAAADVTWEHTSLKLTADLLDDRVKSTFKFANTSGHAVMFKVIQPSCGCISATANKSRFEVDEHGELTVEISLGVHTGSLHKTIVVQTDEKDATPTKLEIEIVVPVPVSLEPVKLEWQLQGNAEAKSVSISTSVDADIIGTAGSASDEWAKGTLDRKSDRSATLTVVPLSTEGTFESTIGIEVRVHRGNESKVKVCEIPIAVKG
jgi:hypothetical protein